jgi:hypothetical protein
MKESPPSVDAGTPRAECEWLLRAESNNCREEWPDRPDNWCPVCIRDGESVSYVWLLKRARWEGDDIKAVYTTSKDANTVLKAIKAEAKKHRMDPDTSHDLEMNLFVEKHELRPDGDVSLTFEDIR